MKRFINLVERFINLVERFINLVKRFTRGMKSSCRGRRKSGKIVKAGGKSEKTGHIGMDTKVEPPLDFLATKTAASVGRCYPALMSGAISSEVSVHSSIF